MSLDLPVLEQFRVEPVDNGIVHLVFDMPGRTMNVFSNTAIHELGHFAAWLGNARGVRGVVVRSGKASAFCAGADLGELGVAYDMIVAAPPRDRFNIAFDHFFPLSRAIRALETAGKPVAVAIAGLALGGGCELALGGHYRVLVDDARGTMGLPESLVGLLPGAGGTQRLPRLIGADAALPVLLEGKRLSGRAALAAGLVHEVTAAGDEVTAAERWLLSDAAHAVQPWDQPGHVPVTPAAIAAIIPPLRQRILAETHGRYPAPLAILDCVEQGLPQQFDAAIRTEMSIFARLIQRREPRDMIQTLFLGKTDYERAVKRGDLTDAVTQAIAALKPLCGTVGSLLTADAVTAADVLAPILTAAAPWREKLSQTEQRMADYALVAQAGFPAYLGGPFAQSQG